MAGINNLGNNLKLQQLQLNSTAKVDTQNNKGKEVGDAQTSAVWIFNGNTNGPVVNRGYNPVHGDVVIMIKNNTVEYFRATINAQGETEFIKITADDVQISDYEKDRGDIRR